jgi:hypothetical protein
VVFLLLLSFFAENSDAKSVRVTFTVTDSATACGLTSTLEGLVGAGGQQLNGTSSNFNRDVGSACNVTGTTTGNAQSATTGGTAGGTTSATTTKGSSVSAAGHSSPLVFSLAAGLIVAAVSAGFSSSLRRSSVVFLGVLTLALLSHGANAALSKTYTNCRVLDGQTDFRLHWTVSGGNVEFAMEAQVNPPSYFSSPLSLSSSSSICFPLFPPRPRARLLLVPEPRLRGLFLRGFVHARRDVLLSPLDPDS